MVEWTPTIECKGGEPWPPQAARPDPPLSDLRVGHPLLRDCFSLDLAHGADP